MNCNKLLPFQNKNVQNYAILVPSLKIEVPLDYYLKNVIANSFSDIFLNFLFRTFYLEHNKCYMPL